MKITRQQGAAWDSTQAGGSAIVAVLSVLALLSLLLVSMLL